MQPPHLALLTHGKLSSHVEIISSRPRPNIKSFSVYTSLSLPIPFVHLLRPHPLVALCRYLSCFEHECPIEKISTQNRTPHIAMRLNLTIAWRASPTRTPPPICTSAPFL